MNHANCSCPIMEGTHIVKHTKECEVGKKLHDEIFISKQSILKVINEWIAEIEDEYTHDLHVHGQIDALNGLKEELKLENEK